MFRHTPSETGEIKPKDEGYVCPKSAFETKISKPPLGVVPKKFYEYDRMQELSRAIYEYIYYYSGKPDLKIDLLIEWTEELLDRLYQYKI